MEILSERSALKPRTPQRLFSEYVGLSPKWVIVRMRQHEAMEQIAARNFPNLAQLAVQLGFFDEAHFIHDFKKSVGCSPSESAARLSKTKNSQS